MKTRYDFFNLNNNVAVVIGGGGHLCSQMAIALSKHGCKVVIIDKKIQKAKITELKIKKISTNDVMTLKVDVTKKNDHKIALKKILKKFKKIDILINGAGINSALPFFDISIKNWNEVVDSQITGTFLGCQVFGEYMVKNGYGSIINISSASASPPLSKAFAYSVSKSGIVSLTKNLAREWANKGVRVNAIRPGFFPTEWNKKNFIDKKRHQQIINHTPMKRYGDPIELCGAIIWLSSKSSSFVTGAEITVDGGFSAMTI